MESIEDKLKRVLAEQLGLTVEHIDGAKTFSDLGADSLDTVEIVMAIEEEFEIEIPDEEAEAMIAKTVGEVIAFLSAKKGVL